MKSPTWITFTPGMCATDAVSTDSGFANPSVRYGPWPRGRTQRPWSIPGRRRLCTYVYAAVTFPGMSILGTAVVTSLYWLTCFDPPAPWRRLDADAGIVTLRSLPPTSSP